MPFWDQWEDARVVYIPFLEGKLSLANLFSSHNEHRILFTRLYGLVLLLLNGQWDNQLQMVLNGVIHCATLAGLGWVMCRWLEKKYWILLWTPLALVLVLPFGWENSLAGFQSQFYFLLLFSLLTLWLLGLYRPGSAPWWGGVATAVMALFTVASGFLAASAVFALVVLRVWRRPDRWKRQVPTLAFCAAVTVAGLLLKADVRHHQVLQAHSVGDFVMSFAENLAWPWIVVAPFALLNLLPLATLGWCYFKSPHDDHPGEELTLAIGLWTVLQGAAAAYARGAGGKPPDWRYMDSSSLILVANCFSIALLLSRWLGRDRLRARLSRVFLPPSNASKGKAGGGFSITPALSLGEREDHPPCGDKSERPAISRDGRGGTLSPRERAGVRGNWSHLVSTGSGFLRLRALGWWLTRSARPLLLATFMFWALVCAAGLALLTLRAWQIDIPERELYSRAQLKYTRAFMATDDIHVFDRVPKPELPYYQGNPLAPQPAYEAELIVGFLRNPIVREILPACARLPLKTTSNPEETHGFVPEGFRLARREPPTEVSWGSWSAQGAVGTGVFESLPIRKSRLPYLEISVAGDLGDKGLSLDLVGLATGQQTTVRPRTMAGNKWLKCYVRAPAGEFKIVARDASKTAWFAFKAPREVGRLSLWAIWALRAWKYVLIAGVGIFIFEVAVLLLGARARQGGKK